MTPRELRSQAPPTFGRFPGTVEDLVGLRRRRALSISVCLPSLDEEATIGSICTSLRELVQAQLVEEVLVLDAGSRDGTARQAENAGATVVAVRDLLQHGDDDPVKGKGKGEAMWRSLTVASGDIVVWLDADIRNFSPAFVTDLVAPLLADPELVMTKAFYDRPLVTPGSLAPDEGGRVTEIAVRPLIQLVLPELSGFVQPLSGECAGYRSHLTKLPFSTGYGVDIGLLIDAVYRWGLDRVGQVDLGMRIHRNQDTAALGRMSFEVMHAIFERLDEMGRIALSRQLPSTFFQFKTATELEQFDANVLTRPPMATVPPDLHPG
jgi:glucosyl-3-phosphoglycerate synthase